MSTGSTAAVLRDRGDVDAALLYAAYARKPLNVLMTVAVALLGGAVVIRHLPTAPTVIWVAALLTTQLAGFVECMRFERTKPPPAALRPWRVFFLIQSGASGAAWALGPALMIGDVHGAPLALFVAALLSVCAVAMISVAEQRGAMQAFIVLAVSPVAVACAVRGEGAEWVVGLAMACGMLLMIVVGRNFNAAMRAVLEAKLRTEAVVNLSIEAVVALDARGVIRDWNVRASEIFGWAEADVLGKDCAQTLFVPECVPAFEAARARVLQTRVSQQVPERIELSARRMTGETFPAEFALATLDADQPDRLLAFLSDVSERKRAQEAAAQQRADEAKARLEARLRAAQKMESVGRLAGGVAHDFNNMLSVILGHAEIALRRPTTTGEIRDELIEIRDAAKRSADLTRQLLAFARQQVIEPKLLSLNDAVAGVLSLLKRLVGENIEVTWHPAESPWLVKIDPSQLDQVLTNLFVNARDAISGVGSVTVKTLNLTIDEAYCVGHPDATPGQYAALVVSDNGAGMAPETLAMIFEPFFTTKGVGQGTGLGLATVYGAVKQNGGFISVTSAPGQGASFTIHFPRAVAGAPARNASAVVGGAPASGVILVAEDEPAVLRLTVRILQAQGYQVYGASGPAEALSLARQHGDVFDLLITDVVMPEMNGKELAKALAPLCPRMRCLYVSGFTADVIASHGVLDSQVALMEKPFTALDLVRRVEAVLAAPATV